MDLKKCNDLFQGLNFEGTPLFESMKSAVNALYTAYPERESVQDLEEEERQSQERQYAFARDKALRALHAYEEARKNSRSEAGKLRLGLCRDTIAAIADMPGPDFHAMGIDEDKIPADADETMLMALAAEKEGEQPKTDIMTEEETEAYLKEHDKLHGLLQADDSDFLASYAENRKITAKLIRIGESSNDPERKKIAENAKLYDLYFTTRMELLKMPPALEEPEAAENELHEGEPGAAGNELLEKKLKEARREFLEGELARLSDIGIGIDKKAKAKRKAWIKGQYGGKTFNVTGSMLEGYYKLDNNTDGLGHYDGKGKVRLGKIGTKINSKWLKFSLSSGVGAVSGTGSVSPFKINTFNNVNNSSLGATALVDAYASKTRAKLVIGSNDNNLTVKSSIAFGTAFAYGSAGAGMFKETDKDGKTVDGKMKSGIQAGGSFNYSLATATLGGTISILGVKISLTNCVYIGGVGGEGSIGVTKGNLSFSLGLALGLGGTVKVNIDWTGAAQKLKNLFRKKSRIEAAKDEAAIRDNLGEGSFKEKDIQKALKGDEAYPSRADSFGAKLDEMITSSRDRADSAAGVQKYMLLTAVKKLEGLKKLTPETYTKQAGDEAMAALVCANIIRIQDKMKVTGKKSLANAIRSEKHMEHVLEQIKQLNDSRTDHKLWDASTRENLAGYLDNNALNVMVKKLLAHEKEHHIDAHENQLAGRQTEQNRHQNSNLVYAG